jgi:hypothetical protein
MKGWKGSALTIMVLLILFCFSAVTVATAAKAKIVSDVKGLQNYVPGDNKFTHGDTLKVYTEMSNVNYEGFVFVEFVFIIKDPKGNVVSMDRMSVERRDYDESAYVVYSQAIPSWWLYGNYKLRISAYNRINKVKIVELEQKMDNPNRVDELLDNDFDDLEAFFESGSDADDLGALKSFPRSVKEVTHLSFFVRPEEEIKPSEVGRIKEPTFEIINVGIDKFTVEPNETVSIAVTVGNAGERATGDVTVVINDEMAATESVTLDYLESKILYFTVKKDVPGTYKVTIPGTDIVKVFFVAELPEETGNSTASAPVTQQSSDGGGGGGEEGVLKYVLVSIAFSAILALNDPISRQFRANQQYFKKISKTVG